MTQEEICEAARKACNEYNREWRRRNPDKVRARNQIYWEKKAMQAAERQGKTQEVN